jgi:putative ABC transport system permease protein
VIRDAFAQAWLQLGRNRTRTALTSLGILIGVAAVILLVGLGRGATARIERDLSAFGDNLLFVVPGTEGPGGHTSAAPLREQDADAIAAQIDGVVRAVPTAARSLRAARGDTTWRTTAWGATQAYFPLLRWELAEGRAFTEGEELAGADVCVLGETVAHALFGAQSPVGQRVRLDRLACRVIGTLRAKGQSSFGQDQDDTVIVPLRTLQRRIAGNRDIAMIFVSVADGVDTLGVQRGIEALMRGRRHVVPGADADFFVRDMAEVMNLLDGVSLILTGFLAAVAGISLLVGGIGIMNIMMVSVTERTREIGVRLAIGATAADVLTQFLVEAVVLALFGGVAGVALGVGGTAAAAAAFDLPLVLDAPVIGLAFLISALIGVGFGYFPARRAAHLDPIEALRRE